MTIIPNNINDISNLIELYNNHTTSVNCKDPICIFWYWTSAQTKNIQFLSFQLNFFQDNSSLSRKEQPTVTPFNSVFWLAISMWILHGFIFSYIERQFAKNGSKISWQKYLNNISLTKIFVWYIVCISPIITIHNFYESWYSFFVMAFSALDV